MAHAIDLWEHPDWARQRSLPQRDDDEGTSSEYTDMDVINDWVVKLTFEKVINNQTELFTGSGFFLNLPNISNEHVILTAAHNLISNGVRTLNLKVIYNNPFQIDPENPDKVIFADDKKPAIIEIPIDNIDNVHICKAYYLGTGLPSVDYAVICIPRTSEGPRGFGFSLKLAHRKSFKGNVHVSGFKGTMMKTLRPFTSSASNITYHQHYVAYQAKTEVGMSGSPVWVEYKGYPTVVAVHVDPNSPKSGNRGAILTVDLLRDVFEWLNSGLLLKGVQIQVRPDELVKHKHRAAGHGLFLSFKTNTGFGRVRLHSGTKFDWMLAQVSQKNVYYALSVVGERKWLRFNVTAKKYQGVELSENMDGRCLLINLADADCAWKILAIGTGVVENDVEKKVKLRMQGTHIKTYDVDRETSEVSLVPHLGSEGKAPFFKLIMSPA